MSHGSHRAPVKVKPKRRNRSAGIVVTAGLLTLVICSCLALLWVVADWDAWVIVLSLGIALLALILGLMIALDNPNRAMFDVEPIDMDDDGSRNTAGYQPERR